MMFLVRASLSRLFAQLPYAQADDMEDELTLQLMSDYRVAQLRNNYKADLVI